VTLQSIAGDDQLEFEGKHILFVGDAFSANFWTPPASANPRYRWASQTLRRKLHDRTTSMNFLTHKLGL
jgi:hypothetical protein